MDGIFRLSSHKRKAALHGTGMRAALSSPVPMSLITRRLQPKFVVIGYHGGGIPQFIPRERLVKLHFTEERRPAR